MAENDEKKANSKDREEKTDPLEILLSGERLTKTEKTRRGEFVLAFPLPSDLRRIEVRVAGMLEGQPASSFPPATLANFRAYATLDVVIVNAPEWWEDMESPEQCPDDELVTDLYGRYLRFYRETQRILTRGRSGLSVGKIKRKNKAEVVDDAPFQGLANG